MFFGLNRREQNMILIGIMIITLVLSYYYLTGPKWTQYQNQKVEHSSIQQRLTLLEEANNNSDNNKGEIETIKDEIRKLRVELPVTQETAGLVNTLNICADKSLVKLDEVIVADFADLTSLTNAANFAVTVKTKGNYPQTRQFIGEIEKIKRIAFINGVTLEQNGEVLNATVYLNVYSAKHGDPLLNDINSIPKSATRGKINPYQP